MKHTVFLKKILLPALFIVPALIGFRAKAQNDTKNGTFASADFIYWSFKNNTGQPVDGITMNCELFFDGFLKIEKGNIESGSDSQPVIIGAPVTSEQKLWLPCNFRVEMANHGVVKLSVHKTGNGNVSGITVNYYWVKNGQKTGSVMSAKTDFTGSIPTQLGAY